MSVSLTLPCTNARRIAHIILLAMFLLSTFAVVTPAQAALPDPDVVIASKELLQFTSAGHILGFTNDGVYVASGSKALRVEFIGAQEVKPVADSPASSVGKDTPLSRVWYPNLWQGISLTYDAPPGAILKSTYRLEARADPAQIQLRYNAPLKINSDGTLMMHYESGEMVETAPIAWQEIDGQRRDVPISFRLIQPLTSNVGFTLGAYDSSQPLFIDPTLIWNTFLGGSGNNDTGQSIAVDSSGNVYVVGYSNATWGSPVAAYTSNTDAFAAKLDSAGALIWNTFLGGSGTDQGIDIAVDSSGNVYVSGRSDATWGSPVAAYTSNTDAFAAKLDSAGALTWNTFLGGSGLDFGYGIAVDGSGNVYVDGYSNATWGSPVEAYAGGSSDAFAAKLSSAGALTWNTFLGGSGVDTGRSIAVDSSGNVYVGGDSTATWGSPVRAYTSDDDAFAAKLSSAGALTWNTFLGGSGIDAQRGIAVDGSGNVYVAGYSNVTWGSPVAAYTGSADAFAAKLSSAGALTWNTFFGGSGSDFGESIAVDSSGEVYVTGFGSGTWGSPLRAYTSGTDAFAAKLSSAGALTWNTFLGGSGSDEGRGIAVNNSGDVYVTGYSNATWGSPLRAHTNVNDAFAAKIGTPSSPPVLPSASFNGDTIVTDGNAFYINAFYGHVHVNTYGNHYRGAVKITSNGITVCIEVPIGFEISGASCYTDREGGRKDFFIKPKTASTTTTLTTTVNIPNGIAVGASGGTFNLPSSGQLIIPPNVLPNGSTLKLEPVSNANFNMPAGLRPFFRVINAQIFNSAGMEIKSFTPPLQLCFSHTDAELTSVGGDARSFVILTSSDGKTLQELASTTTTCASVSHFSLFELAARTPKTIPTTGEATVPWWMLIVGLLSGGVVGWLAARRRKAN